MSLALNNIALLPFQLNKAGVRTQQGILIPPGGEVIYLCNSTSNNATAILDQDIKVRTVTTLAAAVAKCRSGMNDTIIVLPGHAENVTTATMLSSLVAGTRIIGMGDPWQTNAPTFTWTDTAGSWAITVADVLISGLRLKLSGANGITKAINITGAGAKLEGNYIEVAAGAALKSTIAIEVGSGALGCQIIGNYITGTETHNVTDCIKVVGGTTPDNLNISGNIMIASATAANGLVHFTVAVKRVTMLNNLIYNTHTASTAAIACDAVAADGILHGNITGVLNNGTAASQGLVLGATATFKCGQNYCSDEAVKSGALAPAAVAT